MISQMQVDDWLKAHTRVVGGFLVWPQGTRYTWTMSRKIARTYLALGLEPSETVTIDLVTMIVDRLEHLEAMFKLLDTPPARPARSGVQDASRAVPTGDSVRDGGVLVQTAEQRAARARMSAPVTAEDHNLLQTYLEGGTEESQAAARVMDQHAVERGQLSPKTFKAVWGVMPERSETAHRVWCFEYQRHGVDACPSWGEQ